MVDYMLVKGCDRAMVKDVKVIPGEACIPQHKLLICVVHLKAKVSRHREGFVSRRKVWRLKEPDIQSRFEEKVQARATNRVVDDVENMWKGLKDCLLEVTEEECGSTKGLARHTETWWWNQEVAKLVEEKRTKFKIWSKSRTAEDRAAYCQARRIASRKIFKAREAESKKFGDELDVEDLK